VESVAALPRKTRKGTAKGEPRAEQRGELAGSERESGVVVIGLMCPALALERVWSEHRGSAVVFVRSRIAKREGARGRTRRLAPRTRLAKVGRTRRPLDTPPAVR
jgi:hypothetical protein